MRANRPTARAFTLLEMLISLSIVAVLVGLLLPMLIYARDAARSTMCAANLKQIGIAWRLYLDEHGQFPAMVGGADWRYGGAEFIGLERKPILAADRPINSFLAAGGDEGSERFTMLFRCPADRGVFPAAGSPTQRPLSVLGPGGGMSCFEFYGNSYRANPMLLDSTRAGIDPTGRPLKVHEIDFVPPTMLLLAGDAEWSFATGLGQKTGLDASWHSAQDAGNMLAVDGSVRFVTFQGPQTSGYTIYPRIGARE